MKVLVYGSLRKNGWLHPYWMSNKDPIETLLLRGYDMFDIAGTYPAVCKGKGKIVVELYDLQHDKFLPLKNMEEAAGYTSVTIDKIEGTPTMFLMERSNINEKPKVINGDWIKYCKNGQ